MTRTGGVALDRRIGALCVRLIILPIAVINMILGLRPITHLLKGLDAIARRLETPR